MQLLQEADIEYIALEPWVEAIKERTNGRLIINTFPGGTIVPEDQQLEAVARGAIDVSHAMEVTGELVQLVILTWVFLDSIRFRSLGSGNEHALRV